MQALDLHGPNELPAEKGNKIHEGHIYLAARTVQAPGMGSETKMEGEGLGNHGR